ncbi:hypothetical protein JCM5353_007504 [Sporobolomyces roseus]
MQGLTDHLVVAAEEQDVLYVLHWLEEMREENCLEQAIDSKHSWKGYSAVESIIKSPFTQLRQSILEILLLQGADSQTTSFDRQSESGEALQVLMDWESSGKQAAQDARHLLSISLEEAAEWIDQNVPPPPNASSLTGCNDPPAPSASSPSSLSALNDVSTSLSETDSKPSSNSRKHFPQPNSPTPRSRSPSPDYRFSCFESTSLQATGLPSSPSVDPRSRFNERFQSIIPTTFPLPQYSPDPHSSKSYRSLPTPPHSREPSASSSSTTPTELTASDPAARSNRDSAPTNPFPTPSLVHHVPQTRLWIGGLPPDSNPFEVKQLFTAIGVNAHITACSNSGDSSFAFVFLAFDQAIPCIRQLDKTRFNGRSITLYLAKNNPPSTPLPQLSPPIKSPPICLIPSTTNVLILNLPVTTTIESRILLSNFRNVEMILRPDHSQLVAFVPTESRNEGDRIIALWDDSLLSGRKLKVVHAEKGLIAREAVEEYFRKADESETPKEGMKVEGCM